MLVKELISRIDTKDTPGISFEAACHASSNVRKRREKCGLDLMTYEKEYIEMAEPIILESIIIDPIILEVS